MRTLLCSLALTLTLLANASAGRLDLAIVVFPEEKGVAELEAALANERLAEITDSDRTMTKESYLKGGYVLYAQSIAINPGTPFGGSVRIKNNRADLEGKLANGNLDVTISLSEGVKAGLRTLEKKNYTASAPLPAGPATVISLRLGKGKSPLVTKGQAELRGYSYCSTILAQYTP
jgi:hypothetical protein